MFEVCQSFLSTDLTNISKFFIIIPRYSQGGIAMIKTGEKPGVGIYICTQCGQVVRLDDNTDTLPPCPRCGNTTYSG